MVAALRIPIKVLPHFIQSGAQIPEFKTPGASGADVMCASLSEMMVNPGEVVKVPTGLCFELPPGFEIQVRARSGVASKTTLFLPNGIGTIDADYRGELFILMGNWGHRPQIIQPRDRIAQLVLCQIYQFEWNRVTELNPSLRGEGGFGHTGITGP